MAGLYISTDPNQYRIKTYDVINRKTIYLDFNNDYIQYRIFDSDNTLLLAEFAKFIKTYHIDSGVLSKVLPLTYGIHTYLITAIEIVNVAVIKQAAYLVFVRAYENGPVITTALSENTESNFFCTITHSNILELTVTFSENTYFGIYLSCLELL